MAAGVQTKKRYSVRQTKDWRTVKKLHNECFPADDWETGTAYWLLVDLDTNEPVGFASAKKLRNVVYLNRAGVLPHANGRGLQRRLIKARLRWAKKIGAVCAITYTVYDNHPSICNLLKCGFKFFHPEYAWAGRAVHYFIFEVSEP
jgi:GNAT superfamily N-acetyltransferase